MKKIFKYGSYVWSASAAGCLVIGYVTQLDVAYLTGVGCLAMAGLFTICSEL